MSVGTSRPASTPCYASDLEALVAGSGAVLWIHGHTHHCCGYRLGGTRVINNGHGYGEENAGELRPGARHRGRSCKPTGAAMSMHVAPPSSDDADPLAEIDRIEDMANPTPADLARLDMIAGHVDSFVASSAAAWLAT